MRKFEKIRREIKGYSEQQTRYKKLRKSYRDPEYTSTNPVTQEEATNIVWHNKETLRHLFQAYAILRGKQRPLIKKSNHEISERVVQDMVEKYRPVEVEEIVS